jgi:hypothetical protein
LVGTEESEIDLRFGPKIELVFVTKQNDSEFTVQSNVLMNCKELQGLAGYIAIL